MRSLRAATTTTTTTTTTSKQTFERDATLSSTCSRGFSVSPKLCVLILL